MILLLITFCLFGSASLAGAEAENRIWQDETIYSILIDRFHNGDPANDQEIEHENPAGYHGGDLKGIIDKLDYIQEMGFTAIVLSPLFKGDRYDGSSVQDAYQVDERYGTMEQLQQLVKDVHDRDMKVLLSFPVMEDEKEMEKAALWWMDQLDIDGYKFASLDKESVTFWRELVRKVKENSAEFFLIGAASGPNSERFYKEAGFDSIIDLALYEQTSNTFSEINESQQSLYKQREEIVQSYENSFAVNTMIDGEETVRFTRKSLENRHHPGTRTKLALTYLFTSPGIPIVYYGTEIALDGGEKPDNHRSMNFRVEKELIDYITKVNEIRAQLPSLRKGTFELINEQAGMMIYKRTYKDETTVVAINNTDKTQIMDLSAEQMGSEKELRGLLEGDVIRSEEGIYRLALDREKANIYVLKEKTGINVKFIAAMVIVYGTFMLFIYLVWKRGKKKKQPQK
jgi:alpha-amylase